MDVSRWTCAPWVSKTERHEIELDDMQDQTKNLSVGVALCIWSVRCAKLRRRLAFLEGDPDAVIVQRPRANALGSYMDMFRS